MSGMSFVDLTSSSPPGQQQNLNAYGLYNTRNLPSLDMPPERKRRRLNDDSVAGPSAPSARLTHSGNPAIGSQMRPPDDIEAVDMSASSPKLLKSRAKQQEDAVKAQQPEMEPSRSTLTAYKCPVCMDTPEDATTTTCGMPIASSCFPFSLCALANDEI